MDSEPLLTKKKKAKKKKKKSKKSAPRVARGFVTTSRAKPVEIIQAPASTNSSASTKETETGSSSTESIRVHGIDKSRNVSGVQDDSSDPSTISKAKTKKNRLKKSWSLHLPAPLANMFTANKKENAPWIRLDGELEAVLMQEIQRLEEISNLERSDITDNNCSANTRESLPEGTVLPTYKRLNAQYVALERFGFSKGDIHRAMRANLSRPFSELLSWCCLNVEHDDLPPGFTDKGANQLDSESGISHVNHVSVQASEQPQKTAFSAEEGDTQDNAITQSKLDEGSTNLTPPPPNNERSSQWTVSDSQENTRAQQHEESSILTDEPETSDMDADMKQHILLGLCAEEEAEEAALLREMELEAMSPSELYDALTLEVAQLSRDAIKAKKRKDKAEQKSIGLKIRELKEKINAIPVPDGISTLNEVEKSHDSLAEGAAVFPIEEAAPEDVDVGLGSIFEETESDAYMEDADSVDTKPSSADSSLTYFPSLIYRESWTGKSPYELLFYLTRKAGSSKRKGSSKKKAISINRPQFTRVNGRGAGFCYCVALQAGLSKAILKDVCVFGSGRLGYDGGASTNELDLPCRTDVEAKNLAATVALYELFPDQNIHIQLPGPFRNLWKGWYAQNKADASRIEEEKHADKVALCCELEDAWHKDPRSKLRRKFNFNSLTRKDIADEEDDWNDDMSAEASDRIHASESVFKVQQKALERKKNGNRLNLVRDAFLTRISSKRYRELEKTRRRDLPVMNYAEEIVEAVSSNQAVVVQGETGCGKSTQIPHILLKAVMERKLRGVDGEILCTEPRRISATSLARRVCHEMGDNNDGGDHHSFCGYQIRGEKKMSRSTMLTYMTTGILLRRLQGDPMLEGVSVIVVDEVHERTVQSDFLLIALKMLLRSRRSDLKIVLMSATMDAEKVARYMGHNTPVMAIPGRTFPVSVQYLEDIVEQTGFYSIVEGGEDMRVDSNTRYGNVDSGSVQLSRNTGRGGRLNFSMNEGLGFDDLHDESGLDPSNYSLRTRLAVTRIDTSSNYYDLIERTLRFICEDDDSPYANSIYGAVLVFLPGVGEITRMKSQLESTRCFSDKRKYRICALHSVLPMSEQQQAFDIPPKQIRKIILSTNVAETGVTIPDAVFVIDTCLVKETRFDDSSRMRSLVQCRVPRSSAEQRRGRAGRVRNGFCFRLITQWEYDNMLAAELTPEIRRVPLTELVLNILVSNNQQDVGVLKSIQPKEYLAMALDPPEPTAIEAALHTLVELGAITLQGAVNGDSEIDRNFNAQSSAMPRDTSWQVLPLGFHLAKIPADVRIAKMLLMGAILQCTSPIATIAAALSDKSPFLSPVERRAEARMAHREFTVDKYGNPLRSDHLCIVRAFVMWQKIIAEKGRAKAQSWCHRKFLSWSTLHSIQRTRKDLLGYLLALGFIPSSKVRNNNLLDGDTRGGKNSIDYNAENMSIVLAALASGLWPNIATVTPKAQTRKKMGRKPKGDLPAVRTKRKAASLHPGSVNHGVSIKDLMPNTVHGEGTSLRGGGFLCFHSQMKTSSAYLRDTSVVPAAALLMLCGHTTDAKVLFGKQRVVMDGGWLQVGVASKTAVLLLRMRRYISELLLEKIADPSLSIETWRGGVLGKLLPKVLSIGS